MATLTSIDLLRKACNEPKYLSGLLGGLILAEALLLHNSNGKKDPKQVILNFLTKKIHENLKSTKKDAAAAHAAQRNVSELKSVISRGNIVQYSRCQSACSTLAKICSDAMGHAAEPVLKEIYGLAHEVETTAKKANDEFWVVEASEVEAIAASLR